MAELQADVHFMEKRQSTELSASKLKAEQQYAKSRARHFGRSMLKILEELEDDNVDNIKGGALNMAIFF